MLARHDGEASGFRAGAQAANRAAGLRIQFRDSARADFRNQHAVGVAPDHIAWLAGQWNGLRDLRSGGVDDDERLRGSVADGEQRAVGSIGDFARGAKRILRGYRDGERGSGTELAVAG